MLVPTPIPSRRPGPFLRLASRVSFLLLLFASTTLFARGPQPALSIPLEPLGFQPLSTRSLLSGGTMITVDFVDDTHLLVTYNARRLIRRIPNDPPYDQDRNVDALLLELPSGHVLARAEWVFHDHGQYLWNLGHGQFLLRTRDNFSLLAPLANLAKKQAFTLAPFLNSTRHIDVVTLSPDATFLTLETTPPRPLVVDEDSQSAANPFGPRRPPPSNVQLNFYRLIQDTAHGGFIVPEALGGALTSHIVELPLTSGGILTVLDQGHQRWAFDFRSHQGKVTELSLFDSTCRPIPLFVSPSEFIAFGCHNGAVHQQLGAFNLRGDATWQAALNGPFIAPAFAFAPSAGRFALSRVITSTLGFPEDTTDPSFFLGQPIDVYQVDSGKLLLHVDCTPISRAGQNFTLSPDGMNLAMVRDGVLEIYPLPPLSPKDKTAVKLAQDTTPPPIDAPINLAITFNSQRSSAQSSASTSQTQSTVQSPRLDPIDSPSITPPVPENQAPSANAAPPPAPGDTSAPAEPPVRRKPPTLYSPEAPNPNGPPETERP